MDYNKKYWSLGEFTRKNGKPYEGYVGTINRNGYIFDTNEELVANDNYKTQTNLNKNYFDRLLHEDLHLPYNKKSIQIQANDFLSSENIRNILSRLQENNDYIFRNSIISNTLIPNTDNCLILATEDVYHYTYVALSADGKTVEDTGVDALYDENGNKLFDKALTEAQFIAKVENAFKINPLYNANKKNLGTFQIRNGNKCRSASEFYKNFRLKNYINIPNIKEHVTLSEGKLKTNLLSSKKTTNTKLDSTFYDTVDESGVVTPAIYDFDDIVDSELVIRNIRYVDGDKALDIFVFLMFSDKLVIFPYTIYPNNMEKNLSNPTIDFRASENNLILTLDTIDPVNKSSLKFLALKDMKIYDNMMYLVDEKLNMVLRYDIRFLKDVDIWMDDTRTELSDFYNVKSIRLIDSLQGKGEEKDPIYFNGPSSVCADGSRVYIADRGNKCIKVYSDTLNYITTIKTQAITNQDIQTLAVNPYSMTMSDGTKLEKNSLWVFCSAGNTMTLSVISGTKEVYYTNIQKITFVDDPYSWKEEFKSVKFSFCDSNYFYICTTKRVYKLHLSRPNYPFASLSYFKQRILLTTMVWSRVPYPWHTLPADKEGENVIWSYRPPKTSAEILDNKCFTLTGNDKMIPILGTNEYEQFNGDLIFHVGNLYDESKIQRYIKEYLCSFDEIPKEELAKMIKCSGIFLYVEPSSLISSLSKIDSKCYISEDLELIDSNEYVNTLTFNKLIYKVLFNLNTIRKTLLGQFQAGPNLDNIFIYDSLILDDYFRLLKIENNNDFFLHDNEPVSIVINRIFEKIYDLQEKILVHMETKYIAQPSFTNNSFRII